MAQKHNVYIPLRVVSSVIRQYPDRYPPRSILVIRGIRVFCVSINKSIVLPDQMTADTWLCGYMLVVSVENSDLLFNLLHS